MCPSAAVASKSTVVFSAFGGARCEIHAVAADVREVATAIEDVYTFETALTRFDPKSELSRFNASAGERVAVSQLLGALLQAALDAYELSGGLVNAAVGKALVAAGYDRTIEAVKRDGASIAQLAAVPPLPSVLEVGDTWARLERGSAIDLGGMGKGWLADQLVERFDNAVVNLGGDMRAHGAGESGEGWSIRLCDDTQIQVTDAGVATSGIGNRRWPGGHHIIDPRTGMPATVDCQTLSVCAATALQAEVLAKAALLMGPSEAAGWLAGKGIPAYAMAFETVR